MSAPPPYNPGSYPAAPATTPYPPAGQPQPPYPMTGYPPQQQPGYVGSPPGQQAPYLVQPQCQPQQSTVIIQQPVIGVMSVGENPIQTTCPSCRNSITTRVNYEIGTLAWLICAVLCFVGLWLCMFIPFCVPACQDVVHSCPSCGAVIGRYKRM